MLTVFVCREIQHTAHCIYGLALVIDKDFDCLCTDAILVWWDGHSNTTKHKCTRSVIRGVWPAEISTLGHFLQLPVQIHLGHFLGLLNLLYWCFSMASFSEDHTSQRFFLHVLLSCLWHTSRQALQIIPPENYGILKINPSSQPN